MNFDQPHDDSEQMMRMHYGDDDYEDQGRPMRVCSHGCGRILMVDEDYKIGTCKPCRVTEGM